MIPAEEHLFYMALANRMKAERELLDWKQTDLAENSNIHKIKIHRLEGAVDRMRAYELCLICETMNISADFLLGLDTDKRHREYPKIVLAMMDDLATIKNPEILESVYQFVRTVKNGIQNERSGSKKLTG